jgi:hypothetical protein
MEGENPWKLAFEKLYAKVETLINNIEMYATTSDAKEALEDLETLQRYTSNLDDYTQELINTALFDEWKQSLRRLS